MSDGSKEKKRRNVGRHPLKEGVATIPVTIKMTTDQRDKMRRLGGAPWVRKKIDQAKEPGEPGASA